MKLLKRILQVVLVTAAALISTTALAQNARYDNVVLAPNYGSVKSIAGATVTVCAAGASGIPCTPTTAICASASDTTCISTNPFVSDVNGNYGFWAKPGTYTVTVTASGLSGYSVQVTLGSPNSAVKPAASDGMQCVSSNGNDTQDGFPLGTCKASLAAALASSSCASSCVVYDYGPETWNSNPFASFTGQATIHLGPHVFTTNAEVAIPNFVYINGTYPRGASPGQTSIVAGPSFPTTGTVNGGAAIIHLSTSANYVQVSDLTLNCNNVAKSSGFYGTDLQENSGLGDVDVINCVNKGVWMDDSSHTGQNWTINKLIVESPSSSANATYEPLHVDGNGFKAVRDVTLIGAATPSTNCGFVSATVMGQISGLHMEQCTSGLVLDNFQGGAVEAVQCKSNVTNCVKITATNWTVSDSIFGILSLAATSPAILDQQDNVTINTGASGGGLGLFTLDQATPPHVFYGNGTGYVASNLILPSSGGGTIMHQAPNTASSFTQTDTPLAGSTVVNITGSVSIASGFGTTPSIVNQGAGSGPTSVEVNVGTGGVATSGVLTMPAAPVGWSCSTVDMNTNIVTRETAFTTTSVTLTAASAWTASDKLLLTCWPF